jgi:excisionase family DNA binding protein
VKKPKTEKRLYTIKEAAEYLGRSVWGIRELQYKGALPFIKADSRIYFDIHDLDNFIEKNKQRFTY